MPYLKIKNNLMLARRFIMLATIISLIVLTGCSNNDNVSNPVINEDEYENPMGKNTPLELEGEFELSGDNIVIDNSFDISEKNIEPSVVTIWERDDCAVRAFVFGPFKLWRQGNSYIRLRTYKGGRIALFPPNGRSFIIRSTYYLEIIMTDWEGVFVPPLPWNCENRTIMAGRAFTGVAGHIIVKK